MPNRSARHADGKCGRQQRARCKTSGLQRLQDFAHKVRPSSQCTFLDDALETYLLTLITTLRRL
jgi:hypothetical protein